ncbi:MAG: hypothetical protein AAB410_04660 [Patescibacteria group bacterium]
MTHRQKIRLLEFLIIGVVMGTVEDLIAVMFATDAQFSWRILIVVFLVALPFAFISEIVVDHPNFWKRIWPEIKEEAKEIEEKIDKAI